MDTLHRKTPLLLLLLRTFTVRIEDEMRIKLQRRGVTLFAVVVTFSVSQLFHPGNW